MPRPDQTKFDVFARPFEKIDEQLHSLSQGHSLLVEKDLNRQPCRVLKRPGNPHYLIDISYDDYWFETEFREGLPLSVSLVAYYIPPENDKFVWRMSTVLSEHLTLSAIGQNLKKILEEAILLIESWPPQRILREGQRSENL